MNRRHDNINPQSAIQPVGPSLRVCNPQFRAGFTLIELLVVVMIICVLAAIMVPAILGAMTASKRRATQGTIMGLDSACRLFADDMVKTGGAIAAAWAPSTAYAVGAMCSDPTGLTWTCKTAHTSAATFTADAANWLAYSGPPNWPPTTYASLSSDQALVLWLTGYGADNNPAGKGIPTGDMLNMDGKDGYGFRLSPQGRVYGPYGGTENFAKTMVNGYHVFVDAWGGTIHYVGSIPSGYAPVTVSSSIGLIWSQPAASATQYDPSNRDPSTHQPMPMLITNVSSTN
jgi:prepilin-type N-terminal cleavage/methylation domain-containing protein